MKTEKIIISLMAMLIGLLVAGGAFYFFQVTKTEPSFSEKKITPAPTSISPTPTPSAFLSIDKPKDEEVVTKETITLSGKTLSNSTVIIFTNGIEEIVTSAPDGRFNTEITLEEGQNIIEIISISANGESQRLKRTITFSFEEF